MRFKSIFYFVPTEDVLVRIIDSMTIPVCKFGRVYLTKCFKDIFAYTYCDCKKVSFSSIL